MGAKVITSLYKEVPGPSKTCVTVDDMVSNLCNIIASLRGCMMRG
jgi:hypothetical protein